MARFWIIWWLICPPLISYLTINLKRNRQSAVISQLVKCSVLWVFFSFFFLLVKEAQKTSIQIENIGTHTHRVKYFIVSPAVPTQKSYRVYGQIAKVANTYVLPAWCRPKTHLLRAFRHLSGRGSWFPLNWLFILLAKNWLNISHIELLNTQKKNTHTQPFWSRFRKKEVSW